MVAVGNGEHGQGARRGKEQNYKNMQTKHMHIYIYAKYEDRVKSYCIIMDASDSFLYKINK